MRFAAALALVIFLLPAVSFANWFQDEKDDNRLPEAVVQALDTASSVTLYSLEPGYPNRDIGEWNLHSQHILGQVTLPRAKALEVVSELKSDVAAWNHSNSLCVFEPRHAFRVTSEGHVYDLLVCYHCGFLQIFRDEKEMAFLSVMGSPEKFDALLTEANVTLADTPAAKLDDYAAEAASALKEARQGDLSAQILIGDMYLKGRGVEKNLDEGMKWVLKAAENSVDGKVNLGEMYRMGDGVKEDYAEALKWFRMAADQGAPAAEKALGEMYEQGYGVKKDYAEAVKWYLAAADQGNAQAQMDIGEMYMKGNGVNKDNARAYMWMILSTADRSWETRTLEHNLSGEMTPEQISEGKRLAATWKPTTTPSKAP